MNLYRLSWLPATSHGPIEGLHTVLAVANISEGQSAEFPVHFSIQLYAIKSHALPSASQSPDEERQTVEEDANVLEGQEAESPVQYSIH
jgi:hypothetical protein